MFTVILTVEMREMFNEEANRNPYAENIRNLFDQNEWLSNQTISCEMSWENVQTLESFLPENMVTFFPFDEANELSFNRPIDD